MVFFGHFFNMIEQCPVRLTDCGGKPHETLDFYIRIGDQQLYCAAFMAIFTL